MNKKTFLKNKFFILSLAFLLFLGVSQVSAANSHSNNSQGKNHSLGNQEESQEHQSGSITPTVNPSTTPSITANCDDDVRNHGAFVSCIAREHEGGDTVSAAARSDVGKKGHDLDDDDDDINATITPSVSPSVTPTVSPTETPTITPTGTITPSPSETPSVTPTVSPEPEETTSTNGVNSLIKALEDIIKSLKSLLHL